jgi:hypothetical protein
MASHLPQATSKKWSPPSRTMLGILLLVSLGLEGSAHAAGEQPKPTSIAHSSAATLSISFDIKSVYSALEPAITEVKSDGSYAHLTGFVIHHVSGPALHVFIFKREDSGAGPILIRTFSDYELMRSSLLMVLSVQEGQTLTGLLPDVRISNGVSVVVSPLADFKAAPPPKAATGSAKVDATLFYRYGR